MYNCIWNIVKNNYLCKCIYSYLPVKWMYHHSKTNSYYPTLRCMFYILNCKLRIHCIWCQQNEFFLIHNHFIKHSFHLKENFGQGMKCIKSITHCYYLKCWYTIHNHKHYNSCIGNHLNKTLSRNFSKQQNYLTDIHKNIHLFNNHNSDTFKSNQNIFSSAVILNFNWTNNSRNQWDLFSLNLNHLTLAQSDWNHLLKYIHTHMMINRSLINMCLCQYYLDNFSLSNHH